MLLGGKAILIGYNLVSRNLQRLVHALDGVFFLAPIRFSSYSPKSGMTYQALAKVNGVSPAGYKRVRACLTPVPPRVRIPN